LLSGLILAITLPVQRKIITMKDITKKTDHLQYLITKFYYKNNQLCFQILVQDESKNKTAQMEYSDYTEYKKAYNQLMDLKSQEKSIKTPLIQQDSSYMSLS